MKEEFFRDSIFKRLLKETGLCDGDEVVNRFLARAFSYEIWRLWGELDNFKETVCSSQFCIPPGFLPKPQPVVIECSADCNFADSGFDEYDCFYAGNGMAFTPLLGDGSVKLVQGESEGRFLFSANNIQLKKMYVDLDAVHPVFEIVIPCNKELYDISAGGERLKRVYDNGREDVERAVVDIVRRLAQLPVIKNGRDSDILAPYCENIIEQLDSILKCTGHGCGENNGSGNCKRYFFTAENMRGRCRLMVNYSLFSVGAVEKGDLLKYSGDCSVKNNIAVAEESVNCRFERPDFGAWFRQSVSQNRIWSAGDIRDACMLGFPSVIADVSVRRGSFARHGTGIINGIIVGLSFKPDLNKDEKLHWSRVVYNYLVENSPMTYNYLVTV